MTQVVIYFAINASLLAMFAGLWALDGRAEDAVAGRCWTT